MDEITPDIAVRGTPVICPAPSCVRLCDEPGCGRPPAILSSSVARDRLMAEHNRDLRANNRAENSHQPIRRRERKLQRFKSPGSAQRFLAIHAATFNAFTHQRHLLRRPHFKELRAGSFRTWAGASATA
jgi:hypothetical protein